MVDIATGIASLINGDDKNIAVVDYVPDFSLKDLDTQKILVVPISVEWENLTRGQVAKTYHFEIGIMERLSSEDGIEDFVKTVDSIGNLLKNSRVGSAKCMMVKTIQLYDPADFKRSKTATGVLEAVFKMF